MPEKRRLLIAIERGVIQGIATDDPEAFADVQIAVADFDTKIEVPGQALTPDQVPCSVSFPIIRESAVPLDDVFDEADSPQEDTSGLN